jgi:hypothetical protein
LDHMTILRSCLHKWLRLLGWINNNMEK